MQIAATLNLLWFVLGLSSLGLAVRAAVRSRKWLTIVRIAVIVAALFPYISATDDVLRFDHEHAQGQSQSHDSRTENLIQLYQTMDAPLICEVVCVVLTFVFVGFVFTESRSSEDRSLPQLAGRSPPVFV